MSYYNIPNLVTRTKTNMTDKMPSSHGTLKHNYCENTAPGILHTSAVVSAALKVSCSPAQRFLLQLQFRTDLYRCVNCFKIWISYQSYIVPSWMNLHNGMCSQEHLGMPLQSLISLWIALRGPGRIYNYLAVLIKYTWVFGKYVCGCQTDLPYTDVRRWYLGDRRLKYSIY